MPRLSSDGERSKEELDPGFSQEACWGEMEGQRGAARAATTWASVYCSFRGSRALLSAGSRPRQFEKIEELGAAVSAVDVALTSPVGRAERRAARRCRAACIRNSAAPACPAGAGFPWDRLLRLTLVFSSDRDDDRALGGSRLEATDVGLLRLELGVDAGQPASHLMRLQVGLGEESRASGSCRSRPPRQAPDRPLRLALRRRRAGGAEDSEALVVP